jgi:hypothetical protein
VGQAPHFSLVKLNEELEIQADTMLIDLLHEQLRDREKSANRQAEVDAKLVEDDRAIYRPDLETAFKDFETTLDDMIEICGSTSVPFHIIEYALGQAPDWEQEDIEEELIVQCSELLPGLLAKMHEK